MDYDKIRDDAERRRAVLLDRQRQIKHEKANLNGEDDQIRRELIGLDQIVDGLTFVTSDIPPDFEPTGFTDNIRKILTGTPQPLVPTQIRDQLQERGITGSSPKNLLINVHKVLERIEPELVGVALPDGKIAYRHRVAVLGELHSRHDKVPVVDLMASLKKSLAQMDQRKLEIAEKMRKKHEEDMKRARREN